MSLNRYICYVCDQPCDQTWHRVCTACKDQGWTDRIKNRFSWSELPVRPINPTDGEWEQFDPCTEVPPKVQDYIMSFDLRLAVRKMRGSQ